MRPVSNESLVRQLNWRYATKRFNPARKIQPPDWRTLEQALVLSPSSFGLQPWRFLVVTDPEVRAKLRAAAYNQPQVTDASHLVVFAVKKDLGPDDIDRFIARVAEVRGVPPDTLAGYRNMLLGAVNRPQEQVTAWAARQAYIALGTFLTTAALLEIDACPMEGFDPAQFDEILGLDAQGYTSVVIATAGYRAEDDANAKLPKVRFAPEDVIVSVA
jgi:nitroreductase